MKYILSMAMMIALLSCNAQQSTDPSQQSEVSSSTGVYTDVNNTQAKSLMTERPNLQIIDVRTDGEVAAGMIEGAAQIDISKPNFEQELMKLDKSAPVLVYCAAGGRSKTAQDKMIALGFKEVHNLEDGYSGWK